MTTSPRADLHPWSTSWATAPPASCSTLRNLNGVIGWGQSCVFAQEDGDPLPFSINTACMPWVTSNVYPSPSAFYSPATACPTSWTAVATQTTGTAWAAGEMAVRCCPGGFEGDGGDGCRPGSSSGVWPVLECGEADAEENVLSMYTASAWPAGATLSVPALQLRFQASPVSSASAGPSSTGSSGRSGGLSTSSTIALAVAIPLLVVLSALAAFLLWRRKRRHRTAPPMQSARTPDEKNARSPPSLDSSAAYHPLVGRESAHPAPPHSLAPTSRHAFIDQHEIPEWNAELPAAEASRAQVVVPSTATPTSVISSPGTSEAAELGGLLRVARKPIAPVEIDSTSVVPEVGDAYIAYRPAGEDRGERRA